MNNCAKVTRETTWKAFNNNWCPKCAAYTKMEVVRTGLPGISAQTCVAYQTHYTANFLEDAMDELDSPEYFTWPTN